MPLLVFGFVAVVGILWAMSRSGNAGPATPQQQPKASGSGSSTQLASRTDGKTGDYSALARAGAAFLAPALTHAEAQVTLAVGLALAATIAAFNFVAGIVVAWLVIGIAILVDDVLRFSDMTQDWHQAGIDRFNDEWQKAKAKIVSHLSDKMLAQNTGVAIATNQRDAIDRAATAYADGFMQRLNVLRCTSGMSGLNNSEYTFFGAWRKGAYAGFTKPTVTVAGIRGWMKVRSLFPNATIDAMPAETVRTFASQAQDFIDKTVPDTLKTWYVQAGGIWGNIVIDCNGPPPRLYLPSWRGKPSSDETVQRWGLMGEYQANACMFLTAVRRDPGVTLPFASMTQRLQHWRMLGMFQGVITDKGGPGCTLADHHCFSPDNGQTVVFDSIP